MPKPMAIVLQYDQNAHVEPVHRDGFHVDDQEEYVPLAAFFTLDRTIPRGTPIALYHQGNPEAAAFQPDGSPKDLTVHVHVSRWPRGSQETFTERRTWQPLKRIEPRGLDAAMYRKLHGHWLADLLRRSRQPPRSDWKTFVLWGIGGVAALAVAYYGAKGLGWLP